MTKTSPLPADPKEEIKIGKNRTFISKLGRFARQLLSDNREPFILVGVAAGVIVVTTAIGFASIAIVPVLAELGSMALGFALIDSLATRIFPSSHANRAIKVFTTASIITGAAAITLGSLALAGTIAFPPAALIAITVATSLVASVASAATEKQRIQYRQRFDELIIQQNEVFDSLSVEDQKKVGERGVYIKQTRKGVVNQISKRSGDTSNALGIVSLAIEKAANALGIAGGAASVVNSFAGGASTVYMRHSGKQNLDQISQKLWATYEIKDAERAKKINDIVGGLPLKVRDRKDELVVFYIKKTLFESVLSNKEMEDKDKQAVLHVELFKFVKSFSKVNKQHFFEIDNKLLTRNGKTDGYISKENKEWIKTNKTSFLGALPILQMSLNDKILETLSSTTTSTTPATQKIDHKGMAGEIKNELQIQDDTTNKKAFIAYLEDTIFRSYEGVKELFSDDAEAKKFTQEKVTKKVKEYLEYKKSEDGPAIPSKARLQEQFPATFKAISDRPISKRSERIIKYELEDGNMHYYYPKVRNEITKFVVKSALEKIAADMIGNNGAASTKTDKIKTGNDILAQHLKAHKAENKPPLFKGIGISFKKMDDGFLIDGVFSPDIPRFKKGTAMMDEEGQKKLLGWKITHIKRKEGAEHNFEKLKNLPMDKLREFFSDGEDITLTISYKDKATGKDTTRKIICEADNKGYFVTNAASNTKKELDVVCEKYDPKEHGIDVIDGFVDQAKSLGISHETQGILNIPSENIPNTRLRSGAIATQLQGRSTVNNRW